jgi:hypothetical protein
MADLRRAGAAGAADAAGRPGLTGRVTIPEIAKWRGVSVYVVRFDRANHAGWPAPVGARPVPRGRPMHEYDARDIVRFYRAKEQASPQARRGVRHRPARWSPNRRVDDWTIAERLGLSWHTVRSYPAVYARTANPFPPKWYSVLVEYQPRGSGKAITAKATSQLASFLARFGTWDDPTAAEITAAGHAGFTARLSIPGPAAPEAARTWRELAGYLCQEAVTLVTKAVTDAGLPAGEITRVEPQRDGMRRWGDIERWEANRPGSGRHEHRTVEQKDAARALAARKLAAVIRSRKRSPAAAGK